MTIQVEPLPDDLSIRGGWLTPELGGRHLLRPGEYTVVARRTGYYDLEEPIEVGNASSQEFRFRLARLPGLVSVVTRPDVEGAEVSLDGEVRGTTPLPALEVETGPHELAVIAPRYRPNQTAVEVEGGGVEQTVEVVLEPAWAEVSLSSVPPGATLRVDGEEVGVTPVTAEMLEGARELDLTLEGFDRWQRMVAVEAGRPQILDEVELSEAGGVLALTSSPAGAMVSVDGEYRGRTPLDLSLTPGAEHTIQLSKLGHEGASRTVAVESGEEQALRVALKAQTGEVDLVTKPADAEVFVDGVSRGPASQRLVLSAVEHVIEVRKPGFQTFRTAVTPRPGFPQALDVALLGEEEAKTSSIEESITTTAGQELLLVTGGRFLMGTSRREAGRRANEVVREVVLERPFYVSRREVTNREFRRFQPTHSSGTVGRYSLDGDRQPVVSVTWEEAALYCNWLSERESLEPFYVPKGKSLVPAEPPTTGFRMPTEAEWAWVARYAASESAEKYPWGPSMPPSRKSGNYADASARGTLANVIDVYDDGYALSSPVASFPPNALGLFDLGGNVAEWTNDFYAIRSGLESEVATDPIGPDEGRYHVIRGSSWRDASTTELRWAYRDYSNKTRPDLGFRVARYAK